MKKVIVLMSTYNGEQYLEEQVLFIVNQKFRNVNYRVDLMLRDDELQDGTVDTLEKYKQSMFFYPDGNVKGADLPES